MIWPMSIMMKAFTSKNDSEIKNCIKMLMDTDADCHIAFRHQGSSLCQIICLWMLGIIRGEVAVGGSGHDNSKASVFKQLFKSHCNTEVDILFHDAGGGNLTGITSTMCWL